MLYAERRTTDGRPYGIGGADLLNRADRLLRGDEGAAPTGSGDDLLICADRLLRNGKAVPYGVGCFID